MSDQLGEDHVLPSIRLAQIRDCVEDYEWLKLAAAKAGRLSQFISLRLTESCDALMAFLV